MQNDNQEARSIERALAPRQVYCFRVGRLEVRADPITVYVRLAEATDGRHGELLRIRRRSDDIADVYGATEKLIAAVRPAFELPAGFTDADAMDLLDDFLAWQATEEDEGLELSDMVAVYGVNVLTLPYRLYHRLWLSLPRQLARQSAAIASGVSVAMSQDKVDRSLCDAVSPTRADGADVEFSVNAERFKRRLSKMEGRL